MYISFLQDFRRKPRRATLPPGMAPLAVLLVIALSGARPSAAGAADTVLPVVRVEAGAEQSAKETYQATTTAIGKGKQELRDVPQSVTVVTERHRETEQKHRLNW